MTRQAISLRICRLLPLIAVLIWALVPRADAAPTDTQAPEYRIGAKDVLKVVVWGHEDLSRAVVVSAEGVFTFPLIGEVRAAGLTPGELQARLRELLERDYLVNPQVSVTVEEYRSQRVFVLGEAEKPGTYALTGQARLLDVLSQAGGPGKGAGQYVMVVRAPRSEGPVTAGAAGSTTIRVSLPKLLAGDRTENLALQNGDTIYIPKLTGFFVLGEVRKPGAYTLDKETTVLEAITLAGGFTDRAAPSGAKILRKQADGTQETIPVNLSGAGVAARERLLTDGDTVLVPAGNTFYVLGEVKKPGAYQLDQSMTAIEGIALAGGFTDRAAPNRTKIIRTHADGRQETLVVDLNEVVKRGRKDRDVAISPNDVIVVPESFF